MSDKFTESAKGQQCHLRIPGVCNYEPATTVLSHIRRKGGGMQIKPHSVCGVFACSSCHDVADGRVKTSIDRHVLDTYILDGHYRTVEFWAKRGFFGEVARAHIVSVADLDAMDHYGRRG